MPLPVAHGLLGATIVAAFHKKPARSRYSVALLTGALLANAADLDFLLVVMFDSKAWHRGFTHSIVFSLLVCLLVLAVHGRAQFRTAIAYGLAYTSHGLLDYVTSKNGGGVALLWPFSNAKLTLGWWGLSEVPSRMTRTELFRALGVEAVLFSLLFFAVAVVRRRLTRRIDSASGAI